MLSIILPTYNEAANLPELLGQIRAVMADGDYEVIVVDDDSPDKTWQIADSLKAQYPGLKVIRRIGRRGLSSAVTEGFSAAKGDVFVVMDADLQHDPAQIPVLTNALNLGADVAAASRFLGRAESDAWTAGRKPLSQAATLLARIALRTKVNDPMTGFFAVKRGVYERMKAHLRPAGFKIFFEILSNLPRGARTANIPLVFRKRRHGSSKLSLRVLIQFAWQLLRIAARRYQALCFWLVALAMVTTFVPQAWALRHLYINPVLRQTVQSTLSRSAEQRGWLLSELSVQEVHGNRVKVLRRAYHRGEDSVTCHELFYDDTPIQPCAD